MGNVVEKTENPSTWVCDLKCPNNCSGEAGWTSEGDTLRCDGCGCVVGRGEVPVYDRREGADEKVGTARPDQNGRLQMVLDDKHEGVVHAPPMAVSMGCTIQKPKERDV